MDICWLLRPYSVFTLVPLQVETTHSLQGVLTKHADLSFVSSSQHAYHSAACLLLRKKKKNTVTQFSLFILPACSICGAAPAEAESLCDRQLSLSEPAATRTGCSFWWVCEIRLIFLTKFTMKTKRKVKKIRHVSQWFSTNSCTSFF